MILFQSTRTQSKQYWQYVTKMLTLNLNFSGIRIGFQVLTQYSDDTLHPPYYRIFLQYKDKVVQFPNICLTVNPPIQTLLNWVSLIATHTLSSSNRLDDPINFDRNNLGEIEKRKTKLKKKTRGDLIRQTSNKPKLADKITNNKLMVIKIMSGQRWWVIKLTLKKKCINYNPFSTKVDKNTAKPQQFNITTEWLATIYPWNQFFIYL